MSAPLLLDEGCAVLPGEDVLHVLTRWGFHEMRGRGLDRLHRRLGPYLGGRYGEEELLAAVPRSRREAVRRYLAGLRELGVLREGEPAAEPGPATRPEGSRWRLGDRPAYVSLDGLPPDGVVGHEPCLVFVRPEDAAGLLLRPWRFEGGTEPLTAVVVEGGAPGEGELRERAGLARWLLHTALAARPPGESFGLFRLDGATGALERLVSVGPEPGRTLDSFPEQLGIVRPAAVPQVPLVVATAGHPLFAPRVTGFGASHPAVRAGLLRRFVARLLRPGAAPPAPPLVASSHLALRILRLDREAGRRRGRHGGVRWLEEVNLVAPAGDGPVVGYLQEVLRLRSPELPGRLGRTAGGASVWAAGDARVCSHLRDLALAELLLREVWRRYYPGKAPGGAAGEEPLPILDPGDVASDGELRRLLDGAPAALGGEGGERGGEGRRLSLWGVTVYVEDEADGDRDHLRGLAVG